MSLKGLRRLLQGVKISLTKSSVHVLTLIWQKQLTMTKASRACADCRLQPSSYQQVQCSCVDMCFTMAVGTGVMHTAVRIAGMHS